MARTKSHFDRKPPRFKQQALVLVLCEDSKSSLQYLQDAARHFRAYAEIEIAHTGKTDPLNIVAEGVKRQHLFDQVFCAIDRDQHETFDQAVALAADHAQKLDVIVSYPCYEYWLLLHFRKTRKPYARAGRNSSGDLLVKDLREEEGMENYAKGTAKNLFEKLYPKLPSARQRASEVVAEADQDGNLNPSTRLHELIDLFERLGTPQVIV